MRISRVLATLLFVGVLSAGCGSAPRIVIKESVEELQLALAADSNDAVRHYNLGVGLLSKQRYAEAASAFATAVEIDPGFADAYFASYCAAYAGDESLRAEALLGDADSTRSAPAAAADLNLERAFAYKPFFDWRLSAILLGRPPSMGSQAGYELYLYFERIFLQGFRDFSLGRYESAEANLTRTIGVVPEFGQAYVVRGLARAQLERYREAIEDFQLVIAQVDSLRREQLMPIEVNTAELHYLIGHAHRRMGALGEAEAAFKRTLTQHFGYYMAHVQLSMLHAQREDLEGALREMAAAEQVAPQDPLVHLQKGAYLFQTGRFEEAAAAFQQASTLKPRYAPAYLNRAMALERLDRTADARQSFEAFVATASTTQHGRQIDYARERIAALP